jgi:hypothetical protein
MLSGFVDLWQALGVLGIVEEHDHEGIRKIGEVNDMLGAAEESEGVHTPWEVELLD